MANVPGEVPLINARSDVYNTLEIFRKTLDEKNPHTWFMFSTCAPSPKMPSERGDRFGGSVSERENVTFKGVLPSVTVVEEVAIRQLRAP